ncbi:MAG: hypothetical protein KatS3mg053_1955 [Candidatus Roseilinea sp.]|nr:MAG: hypothetical protein KatS3mg053_1955 [Candidatus Roseilinea sp.]
MFDTYSFHLLMRRRIRLAVVALTLMLSVFAGMMATYQSQFDLPSASDGVELSIAVQLRGHVGQSGE